MLLFKKQIYPSSASLSSLAWKRFLKNKPAVGSLVFLTLAVVVAILGYLITPDPTPFTNEQHLELSTCKPGFTVYSLLIAKSGTQDEHGLLHKMIYGSPNPYTVIPLASWERRADSIIYVEFSPDAQEKAHSKSIAVTSLAYPTKLENSIRKEHFLLGTDRFGRDVLSQLMIGTRVSLSVGFIAVFISLIIGIVVGAVGGFFRGWVDNAVVWLINVVWSIPTLLLVIAITFALGKGFWQVFFAVGLTMWVEVARVVRGQIFSIREKEFVEAARAFGFRSSRIILRHILPNIMGPVIVISAANFASAILMEAGLSFLGIGVQPPMPSWGTMIRENYAYIVLDGAYLAIFPGIAIMLMVLCFMLIGNALRDALDVKTVGK